MSYSETHFESTSVYSAQENLPFCSVVHCSFTSSFPSHILYIMHFNKVGILIQYLLVYYSSILVTSYTMPHLIDSEVIGVVVLHMLPSHSPQWVLCGQWVLCCHRHVSSNRPHTH